MTDDLKWFGEGFDGFPKKLPEDVVEYLVFVVNDRLSDLQTRERLQAFQRALHDLEKMFLKEYIWQRDALKLDLVREENRWLLKGRTNYGDSVADEWLIVYFLRELSKEFKDAWVRIYDSDGEFLLIEAANALPKWLTPEVAEHRVWINYHRLLIVPIGKQEQEPAPLELEEALQILTDTPARPQQYPKVEKEAFHRLNNYPAAIAENQHHATLPLPRKVAHVLNANPSYISPAVEAFYLRDPVSLRLLHPEKSTKALLFRPEDCVEVSVRFTKVLYAQLLGQHWVPPPEYEKTVEKLVQSGHAEERSEVSIKLTAGMQMLATHSIFSDRREVQEINLLLEDLESGDDVLPTDAEIAAWPKREDDEAWLNIDFDEFEKELQGKGHDKGFGDKNAQDNLKKMVERFNTFLDDNEATHEGASGTPDPMDEDNDSDAGERGWDDPEDSDDEPKAKRGSNSNSDIESDDDDDAAADAEYTEYKKYFDKYMTLSAAEKAILTEDARELARAQDAEQEEDEEIKKLSDMMEAELFSHGALNLNPPEPNLKPRSGVLKARSNKRGKAKSKQVGEGSMGGYVWPEDASEDDDDNEEELLDADYNLAENMLKAFKGEAGLAGPAGNMMRAMGIQFPQDKDDEIASSKTNRKGGGRAT